MSFRKWLNLRTAYRATFWQGLWRKESGDLTEHAQAVLIDLKKFCGADTSVVVVANDGHIDTHGMAYAAGKREALRWIQSVLNLTDEQLMLLKEQPDHDD